MKPTCLVCRDVNHGKGGGLVAEVGHCVHGQHAEGVVGVSHQVDDGHPALRQAVLARDEANRRRARALHQPSASGAQAGDGLPAHAAPRLGVAVLAGSAFPRAFLTQDAVQQVAAAAGVQGAVPLQVHRGAVDRRDGVHWS